MASQGRGGGCILKTDRFLGALLELIKNNAVISGGRCSCGVLREAGQHLSNRESVVDTEYTV